MAATRKRKLTKQVILKGLTEGKSRAVIARENGVTWGAVHKQLKSLINKDAVNLYDNKLPEVLKTAAMTFVSDSIIPAKLQKSSTLQSMTAAGIAMTHLSGLPKTQINIQIIQQKLQDRLTERQKLEHEISMLTCDTQHIDITPGSEEPPAPELDK